jgi:hypothetical protein
MPTSEYFSQNQLKGLLKTGDIILPGSERSPSFSKTGCIAYMDRMLAYLSQQDLDGLRLLFGIFRWSPKWFIHLILMACKHNRFFPWVMGAALRMLEIGIKGAVMTPYYANIATQSYAGPKVFDIIGWDAKMEQPIEY